MHWLTLSFSEHLFGILDAWLVPDAKYKLWYLRFVILTPYALAALLFTFTKYFKRYWQFAVTTVVIVAGLCIIAMISIAPYPASHSRWIDSGPFFRLHVFQAQFSLVDPCRLVNRDRI